MNQASLLRLLDKALARRLPNREPWQRHESTKEGAVPGSAAERWLEVRSDRNDDQRLVVLLRPDGDVQVEYHLGKPGSPFEALFLFAEGDEATVAEQVAAFVADLLDERLVLAYEKGFWNGGRQFLRPHEVHPPDGRRLRWTASWRGTYDWPS